VYRLPNKLLKLPCHLVSI